VEFVLVHGSTQSPAGWDRLAAALRTRGHYLTAIDLPPGRPEWAVPPGITCSFILPVGDRTLRPDWMRHAARERLGTQPVEVSAGHCPHASQPEVIAGILAQT
jgi:pimeloyl-ACP methyl ester carboxylesterase